MKLSFIVIGRTESECEPAINSIAGLKAHHEVEVLIATGSNPSRQRNEAAKLAQGDYLVFLDNDSAVDPRLAHYFEDALSYDSEIKVVGGPSIYNGTDSWLKQCFQAVFASVFGLGPFRARYSSLGVVRPSNENELILCNLMVERKFFLDAGGFNENLYPNEENEFLNRIKETAKVYYHPLAVCYREPRNTFSAFAKQVFRYGVGRAKHSIRFPTVWNQVFLVPALFAIYIVALASSAFLPIPVAVEGLLFLPLAIYAVFNFTAACFAAMGTRKFSTAFAVPFFFFICHFCYGIGFLVGAAVYPFLHRDRPFGEVKITRSQLTLTKISRPA